MDVLHLSAGNLFGGVESMLATLARNRHRAPACRPHFGVCYEGRLSAALWELGAAVHVLGGVRLSRPWTVWQARRALRRLLARERFDRVVCHSAWAQVVFAPVVRSAGLPLVFWLHDAAAGRHWLERWARRHPPDLAVCNSRHTAATLPCLYPNVRAEVLHCPVDPPSEADVGDHAGQTLHTRRRVRQALGSSEETTVLIQVSRLEAWKGHALHLEALALLRHVPDWECWLVGGAQRPHEQEYQARLEQQAVCLGIQDRVRFLGQRPDVRNLLTAADIYCQPNTGPEPFGIAFIEALFAGSPVVTTAMGGALEIVDQTCGVLVPPDAAALAQALEALIADPVWRAELGGQGPARARAISDPARQLARLEILLESVGGSAGAEGRGRPLDHVREVAA